MVGLGNVYESMNEFDNSGSLWRLWRHVGAENCCVENLEDVDVLEGMYDRIQVGYWDVNLEPKEKSYVDKELNCFNRVVWDVKDGGGDCVGSIPIAISVALECLVRVEDKLVG